MLNNAPPEQHNRKLHILNDGVGMLGSLIARPRGWLFRFGLRVIRFRESDDVPKIIDVLSRT
jgi:hypothetical protein